jgi:hypothetical protein
MSIPNPPPDPELPQEEDPDLEMPPESPPTPDEYPVTEEPGYRAPGADE